jgi:hypothetical protein
MWFNISSSSGNFLKIFMRDVVDQSMTAAQIAEAQRLAREWMEKHP